MSSTGKSTNMETRNTHMVIIIDAVPPIRMLEKPEKVYEQWLDSVIAFANSHLLMNAKNSLTVIGSHLDNNQLIYPGVGGNRLPTSDGQHEHFALVTEVISREMKNLAAQGKKAVGEAANEAKTPESRMAGAVGLALCRINKIKEQFDSSRIAIISSSTESQASFPNQYMNFMNDFFTAQKMGVVIDVCVAASQQGDNTTSLLQQGCEITGGQYISIPNISAFLEYLLWMLLPDFEARKKLVLPPQRPIGYKAACFCHKHFVEVAYVCSVCLSIFCTFSPICSTCHTIFKLGPLPATKNKKRTPKKS